MKIEVSLAFRKGDFVFDGAEIIFAGLMISK